MSFGNVPADMLAGATEKLLAKMDESELASFYQRELSAMPSGPFHALVEALFEVFRERGESSDDVAEGAGTTVERIARRENGAVKALIDYSCRNPGALKESATLFVRRRPDFVSILPLSVRDALADHLTRIAPASTDVADR